MIGTVILVLAGLSLIGLLGLGLILGWVLAESSSDAETDAPRKTMFGAMRKWVTHKPKRLDYRRDKKGRFRKIRRG